MGLSNGKEVVSRRVFLLTGIAGLTAGTTAAGLSYPENQPPLESNGYGIFPGWIENNVGEKFIQAQDGHFRWFREAVFQNPVVLETTKKFISHLMDNWQSRKRVELGTSLAFALTLAEKEIRESRLSFNSNSNYQLEALHVATLVFAAGFTGGWFTKEELRKLGFTIDDKTGLGEYFWDKERGVGTVVFPKLFGIDREEPVAEDGKTKKVHFGGQDRTIHFAHHLLTSFVYMYSKYYGLSLHKSMPGIIRAITSAVKNDSTQSDTIVLSEVLGRVYEFMRIFHPDNLPFGKNGDEITDGAFDNMVEADYKGNRFGTEVAIEIFRRCIDGELIDPVLEELNDERFSRFEEEPRLFKA